MPSSIRRNDLVQVLRGKDRGKRGKVQRVLPKEARLVVEGVNIVKRHTRASGGVRQAGIVQKEAPIPISKVTLVCPHCTKPTRLAFKQLDNENKVRVCKQCHEVME